MTHIGIHGRAISYKHGVIEKHSGIVIPSDKLLKDESFPSKNHPTGVRFNVFLLITNINTSTKLPINGIDVRYLYTECNSPVEWLESSTGHKFKQEYSGIKIVTYARIGYVSSHRAVDLTILYENDKAVIKYFVFDPLSFYYIAIGPNTRSMIYPKRVEGLPICQDYLGFIPNHGLVLDINSNIYRGASQVLYTTASILIDEDKKGVAPNNRIIDPSRFILQDFKDYLNGYKPWFAIRITDY